MCNSKAEALGAHSSLLLGLKLAVKELNPGIELYCVTHCLLQNSFSGNLLLINCLRKVFLMEWITDNWFPILLIGAFIALQLSGYG